MRKNTARRNHRKIEDMLIKKEENRSIQRLSQIETNMTPVRHQNETKKVTK